MTSKNLPWHGLTAQLFLKFLLITQHEVPFINTSEATKRLSYRTENGKCTDVTNRRSRVGLSDSIYTNHRYNYETPDLFWWVFSLSHIFTDLIMHNNWSNQSALMTRWLSDFRHQSGIFGGESQISLRRFPLLSACYFVDFDTSVNSDYNCSDCLRVQNWLHLYIVDSLMFMKGTSCCVN